MALRVGLIAVAGALCLVVGIYFFNPLGARDAVISALFESQRAPQRPLSTGAGAACSADAQACDFIAAVLGSTEEVWTAQFQQSRLPYYFVQPPQYRDPTLVVFIASVSTGCGEQAADGGPFYCPRDQRIYIDPTFYAVMERELNAPGDFAQAYVIAHEVGHHVQHLLEVRSIAIAAESDNQLSMRRELQADCFAGVWASQERVDLSIDATDLQEGLNAAFALGDDTLAQGQLESFEFTHGTSAQRMRWLRRGFDSGDARECDTFAVPAGQL